MAAAIPPADGTALGSDDVVPKAFAQVASSMSEGEAFAAAVALVRGTRANYALCLGSMVVSLSFTLAGYLVMTEGDTCSQALPIVTVLFVVSQAFSVTKISRDHKMAELSFADASGEAPAHELAFLRPTPAYMGQVLAFFVVAVGSAIFSLVQVQTSPEWLGFACMSLIWTVVSALCVSKSVRDQQDATNWAAVPASRQRRLEYVLELCGGTPEYQALVWSVFPAALLFTLIWIWAGRLDLALERKSFLSLGLVFNATSCFHLAKLARDREQPEDAKRLQGQIAFQLMTAGSFVISLFVPLAAVCVMPLTKHQRLFLLVGQLMTANAAMNLAKLVRDRLEVRRLRARIEPPAAAACSSTE